MSRKSRLLKVASVLAVAGTALAGCAGDPGTAAVVDGESISESYLADATTGTNPYVTNPITPSTMLGALILAPVTLDVASEHGIAVSAGQAERTLDSVSESVGVPTEDGYADGTIQFVRMVLVNDAIGTSPDGEAIMSEISERLGDVDVTVNPRYGEWDGAGSIAPLTPEWLVDPVAVAE